MKNEKTILGKKFLIAAFCSFSMLLMCQCSGNTSRTARNTAIAALEFSEKGKENINILQVSRPDSVMDYKYFSMDDSETVMRVMDFVSNKTADLYRGSAEDGQFNPAMEELAGYSSDAANIMQSMMSQLYTSTPPGQSSFTGWKVKIIYDRKNSYGGVSRLQAWFILTPDGRSVVKSFSLPFVAG